MKYDGGGERSGYAFEGLKYLVILRQFWSLPDPISTSDHAGSQWTHEIATASANIIMSEMMGVGRKTWWLYSASHLRVADSVAAVLLHLHSMQSINRFLYGPTPEERVRKWQANLRAEQRRLDREMRQVRPSLCAVPVHANEPAA